MEPGVVYSAPSLAGRFGVSATPVREAMLDLVREGMVTIVPNKGFRVTEVDDASLDQVTQIRQLLEPPVVGRMTPLVPADDLPGLRQLAQDIVDEATAGDLVAYTEADRQFHLRLLSYDGNPRLVDLVSELRSQTRLLGLSAMLASGVAGRERPRAPDPRRPRRGARRRGGRGPHARPHREDPHDVGGAPGRQTGPVTPTGSDAGRTAERGVGVTSAQDDGSRVVEAFRAGDDTALAELYARWSPLVYSLALRSLDDVGLAEQVTRRVFTRAWRQRAGIDPDPTRFADRLIDLARAEIAPLRGHVRRPAEAAPLRHLSKKRRRASPRRGCWPKGWWLRTGCPSWTRCRNGCCRWPSPTTSRSPRSRSGRGCGPTRSGPRSRAV